MLEGAGGTPSESQGFWEREAEGRCKRRDVVEAGQARLLAVEGPRAQEVGGCRARKGKKGLLPRKLQEEDGLAQISPLDLRNHKIINLRCYKPLRCGHLFVLQPRETTAATFCLQIIKDPPKHVSMGKPLLETPLS